MSYVPPAGDALVFGFSGAQYTPPAGGAIIFAFGDTVPATVVIPSDIAQGIALGAVSLTQTQFVSPFDLTCKVSLASVSVIEMLGIVPAGLTQAHTLARAVLSQIHGIFPVNLANIDSQSSSITPLPAYWLPVAKSPGIKVDYGTSLVADAQDASAWGEIANLNGTPCREPWMDAGTHADNGPSIPYKSIPPVDASDALPYAALASDPESDTSAPWVSLTRADEAGVIPWGVLKSDDIEAASPYNIPPPMDLFEPEAWEAFRFVDLAEACGYRYPPPADLPFDVVWGPNAPSEKCYRVYVPPSGDALIFDLGQPLDQPAGDHLIFRFDPLANPLVCDYIPGTGPVDPWHPPGGEIIIVPVLEAYIMSNIAYITRISDGAAVDALQAQLTLDMSSWTWGFTATLGSRAALDLVIPQSGVTVPLQVSVNGQLWTVMVESWKEDKLFGKSTWTVTGRSTSAELAAPYAPSKTYLEASDKTAVQLAEQELLNTGWTIDWQPIDWLVPGGCFGYVNQPIIQNIQQIADAAGGIIQTDPTAQTLHVVSRYKTSPWNWGQATPDVILPDSIVKELSREYKPAPAYNAVYVSGQMAGGVTVWVKRTGTAGDIQMPQIVHALITSREIGQERGRIALSSCGAWETVTILTQLAIPPDSPALILPGKLIQVVEGGVSWKGQVSGVTISAQWQTGTGIYVLQQLEVERYYG